MLSISTEKNTKQKILDKAKEMFAEKGYHQTSMSAIAERAGVSKGSLYWYFESKQELFNGIIKEHGKLMKEELQELRRQDLSSQKIMEKFINIRVQKMINHKQATRMFLNNENFLNLEFKNIILNIRNEFISQLAVMIERGIEEGVFNRLDARKTAAAIVGMINSLGVSIVTDDFDENENIGGFLCDFIFQGLLKKGETNEKNAVC